MQRNHKNKLYRTWCSMRQRCQNPQVRSYPLYGGRGIKVCERWLDFNNFAYDMGAPPTELHSIERLDGTKDYTPENCIWATFEHQANNRRSSRYLSYQGQTLTCASWSKKIGISQGTLHARLRAGWSVERSLTECLGGSK